MCIVRYLAEQRYQANRKGGVPDGVVACADPDLIGVQAELHYAKTRNVYPDLTTQPRCGGYDCIDNGYRVDIKATNHSNGRLLARMHHRYEDIDIFVLVTCAPLPKIVGWAWREELLARVEDIGHGDTYALRQSDLHPMSEFPDKPPNEAASYF